MSKYYKINKTTFVNFHSYTRIEIIDMYSLYIECYDINDDLVNTFVLSMEEKDKFLSYLYGEQSND